MNVVALKENCEKIYQKKTEDVTSQDLKYLKKSSEYFDQKFVKAVNENYECVNNFQHPPDVRVEFWDSMDAYMKKLIIKDGSKILFLEDKLRLADKIEFINNYGYFICTEEKDGKKNGYENPSIYIGNRDFKRISNQILDAIRAMNLLPRIFQYKGQIIRLLFIDGQLTIKYLNKYDMLHVFETVADYYKFRKQNADFTKKENIELEQKAIEGKPVSEIAKVPNHPTTVMAEYVMATPNPPFPVLEGIKSTPYFDADGDLIVMPHYSEKTRCYLHDPNNILGPNLRSLSLEEAKRLLFEEVLVDFPFVSESDLAHSVALLIQPFVRQMIDGPTPLHIVDSSKAGTGKTQLVESLTYIGTGRDIELQAMPSHDDEIRKCIISTLRNFPSHFVFDNCNRKVDSGSLSGVLTSMAWEGRELGKSKNISVPVNCTWILTGNNVRCSGEIARRSIRIRMDSGEEQPWRNREYKHKFLMTYIKENRELLMWAAITIVDNWIKMGMPKFSGKPLGKFESWSEITGGILEAAGITGFMEDEDMNKFYEDVDEDMILLKALVFLWHEKYGVKPAKASDLTSLEIPIDCSRKMGAFLKANKDTRVILKDENGKTTGDFTIRKGGLIHNASRWYLAKGDSVESGDQDGDQKNVIPIK